MFVKNLTFIIIAWDFDGSGDHEDIDTITQTIDFQGNDEQQSINKCGVITIQLHL